MARDNAASDPIEAIWQAIGEGDAARALQLARALRAPADDGIAALAIAAAHLEAGELQRARELLLEMAALSLDGDEEYDRIWYLGEVSYRLGYPEEALNEFSKLEPQDREERARLAWTRGLCLDHTGRIERADRAFAEATRLDPDEFSPPVPITREEMEKIAHMVRARLPEKIRALLDEVPVVVENLPSLKLIRESKGEIEPDLLGLYTGTNIMDRSVFEFSGLPAQIFLYRRNLQRFALDRQELVAEVEKTLLHELGHHLGYEEEGLDQLGLG